MGGLYPLQGCNTLTGSLTGLVSANVISDEALVVLDEAEVFGNFVQSL